MMRRACIVVLLAFSIAGADLAADEVQSAPRMTDERNPQRLLGPPDTSPSGSGGHRHGRQHGHRFILIRPPWYWSRRRYESLYTQPRYYDYHGYYGPYFYYSYSGPAYVPDYRGYVILGTPTVPQEPPVAEPKPSAPVLRQAVRPGEERAFESKLAPMFGGPDRVGAAFALGEARLEASEFEEAVAAFQHARELEPDDLLSQVGLGLALIGAERYAGAAYMLRRGLGPLADWQAVRVDLARAFGGEQRYATVSGHLLRAAESAPSDADLQLLLGFHHFGTGQYAKAASALLPLHQSDPSDAAAEGLLLAAEARLGEEAPSTEQPLARPGEGEQQPPAAPESEEQSASEHPG